MAYSVPIHPAIVHFPIVLLFSYAVFEIISAFAKKEYYRNMAIVFLAAGVIGLLAAGLTGNYAEQIAQANMSSSEHCDAIRQHEALASMTIWFFTTLAVLHGYIFIQNRKGKIKSSVMRLYKYVSVLLAIIGCIMIFITAKEGGALVFKKGIGTELMQKQISGAKNE